MNMLDWSIGHKTIRAGFLTGFGVAALVISGCQPKMQIVAPDKPIEINLNVKIDQEVRVKLDKEVEDLISQNPDLF